MKRMWLEDMDTGERIEAVVKDPLTGEVTKQSQQFNMDGSTVRTFRWVLDSYTGRPPIKPRKPKNVLSGKLHDHKMPHGLVGFDTPQSQVIFSGKIT